MATATYLQVACPCLVIRDQAGAQHTFLRDTFLPSGLDDVLVERAIEEGAVVEVDVDVADDVASTSDEESDKIADILDRVGDDKDAAAVALAKEQEKGDDARPSLVSKLTKVIEG